MEVLFYLTIIVIDSYSIVEERKIESGYRLDTYLSVEQILDWKNSITDYTWKVIYSIFLY